MLKNDISHLNTQIAVCIQKVRYTEAKLVNESIKKESDLDLLKDFERELKMYIKELDLLRRERACYFHNINKLKI